MEIDNVRFSEPIYVRGVPVSNLKQGFHNAVLTEEKGSVLVDLPPDPNSQAPRSIFRVPFSKVKQIEYQVNDAKAQSKL